MPAASGPVRFPDLGLIVAEPTPGLAQQLGYGTTVPGGLFVLGVTPGGRADLAGVETGMVITDASRQKVSSMEDFRKALSGRPAGSDLVFHIRKGEKAGFRVLLGTGDMPEPLPAEEPPAPSPEPLVSEPSPRLEPIPQEITAPEPTPLPDPEPSPAPSPNPPDPDPLPPATEPETPPAEPEPLPPTTPPEPEPLPPATEPGAPSAEPEPPATEPIPTPSPLPAEPFEPTTS